ncbi:MAG: hypothetical protein GY839_15930 [candidate division Zixibacteria bacterium]|nr:hypothetical protein [candidate division Zixibacteria bacterium]
MMKLKIMLMNTMMPYMASCEEVAQLTSEAMDHKLSIKKRLRMRLHILFCQWCRKYGIQLNMIKQAARKYLDDIDKAEKKLPDSLSPDFKARLKKFLRDNQ